MSRLQNNPTAGQVKEFLLSVINNADNRKSRINPTFTKRQMWDVFMDSVIIKDSNAPYCINTGVAHIAVKNINREFGSRKTESVVDDMVPF